MSHTDEVLEGSTEYAIIGTDADGRIELWNEGARRTFGYQKDNVVGKSVAVLHEPGSADEALAAVRQLGSYHGRLLAVREDRSRFTVDLTVTRRREGYLLIARDVSAQVARLARLEHDLRSPLNTITGFASLMHDGKVGPISPLHKEYLGDILICAQQLVQIISGLDEAVVGARPEDRRRD